MEAAPDRFRFILERPIVGEPGRAMELLRRRHRATGALIAKGTGEPLLAYCRRVLFDPMGFGPSLGERPGWRISSGSGLRLLPRDLLKIGHLVLAGESGMVTDRAT